MAESFRSTLRNAKNTAANVFPQGRKPSGIVDSYVGAVSTARSSKCLWPNVASETVSVSVPGKQR
jgi:hypothetical protein